MMSLESSRHEQGRGNAAPTTRPLWLPPQLMLLSSGRGKGCILYVVKVSGERGTIMDKLCGVIKD